MQIILSFLFIYFFLVSFFTPSLNNAYEGPERGHVFEMKKKYTRIRIVWRGRIMRRPLSCAPLGKGGCRRKDPFAVPRWLDRLASVVCRSSSVACGWISIETMTLFLPSFPFRMFLFLFLLCFFSSRDDFPFGKPQTPSMFPLI